MVWRFGAQWQLLEGDRVDSDVLDAMAHATALLVQSVLDETEKHARVIYADTCIRDCFPLGKRLTIDVWTERVGKEDSD